MMNAPAISNAQAKAVRLQMEETLAALRATTDKSERERLLRIMRQLMDQADRLLSESDPES